MEMPQFLDEDPLLLQNHELVPQLSVGNEMMQSIWDFEFENGRRYHGYKAGSYPLPNDEEELERLDIKHHVMMLLCGGHLHLAPLASPGRILDIGTGSGIWAMQMAEQYPESLVIGTDLSPVQPENGPSNVQFMTDDVNKPNWTWPDDNYFDYIHSRYMIGSIENWKALVAKAYKSCKPGSYFELQELDPRFRCDDGTLPEGSFLSFWSQLICDASIKYNRPIPQFNGYRALFEEAGFVDVEQVILKSPTNNWWDEQDSEQLGRFQLLTHLEGMEAISMGLLTRALHWNAEEVRILMARLRPELKDKSIHSYQINVVVFGRKPNIMESPESIVSS